MRCLRGLPTEFHRLLPLIMTKVSREGHRKAYRRASDGHGEGEAPIVMGTRTWARREDAGGVGPPSSARPHPGSLPLRFGKEDATGSDVQRCRPQGEGVSTWDIASAPRPASPRHARSSRI